jgi:hypothetical protein
MDRVPIILQSNGSLNFQNAVFSLSDSITREGQKVKAILVYIRGDVDRRLEKTA